MWSPAIKLYIIYEIFSCTGAVTEMTSPARDTTSNDLEVVKTLLRQLQERFDKMEVSLKPSTSPLNDAMMMSKAD